MLPDLAALRRRLQVSPVDDRTALIEAAVLYRSVARPIAGATGSPSSKARQASVGLLELDTLTSFDTAAAAARFAGTIRHSTGVTPRVESRVLGIRHRHEMHFVRIGDPTGDAVLTALSGAWREAQAAVSTPARGGTTGPGITPLNTRRGPATAVAIWRALLLATTPVRNTPGLRLRIRDAELLALAVRSAQMLGVSTSARSVSGLGVLCIDEPEQVNRLLERLVTRLPGRRVPTPRPSVRVNAGSSGEPLRSALRKLRREAHDTAAAGSTRPGRVSSPPRPGHRQAAG